MSRLGKPSLWTWNWKEEKREGIRGTEAGREGKREEGRNRLPSVDGEQRKSVCKERNEHSEKSREESRGENSSICLPPLDLRPSLAATPPHHSPRSFTHLPWFQAGSVTTTSSHHLPSHFSLLPHMYHITSSSASQFPR